MVQLAKFLNDRALDGAEGGGGGVPQWVGLGPANLNSQSQLDPITWGPLLTALHCGRPRVYTALLCTLVDSPIIQLESLPVSPIVPTVTAVTGVQCTVSLGKSL